MRYDNDEYMVFVLGYDLLQKLLWEKLNLPCDIAFEVCERVYDDFVKSEENQQSKSEYECLQDWVQNNEGKIKGYIPKNF